MTLSSGLSPHNRFIPTGNISSTATTCLMLFTMSGRHLFKLFHLQLMTKKVLYEEAIIS
ncbi:hypothetical protein Hdeb2414_s0002g00045141 [Helianthus debilis subsp. tardiflorus]